MKKILIVVVGLLLLSLNVFADDVLIDSNGNVTTGVSNTDANLEVTGASGEDAIIGSANGTGAAGVYGEHTTEGSVDHYGILGDDNYGVYGYSPGGYAGYFEGNVYVTGTLGAGTLNITETDPTVNALGKATLSCYWGQIVKWNGDVWECASDTIASLYCAYGEIVKWNGVVWECASDKTLTEGQVDTFVSNNGYLTTETDPTVIASVKDGVDWTELTGIPAGFADGIDDTGSDSLWSQNGSGIYYSSGNVGIGTTTPSEKLTVNGTIETTSGGIKFSDETIQTTAAAPTWHQILPAADRFMLVMNNEAVLDKETGLVWEKSLSTSLYTWVNAQSYCYQLEAGGRKGWHLPTIEQLASLVDTSVSFPPMLPTGHPFLNVQSSSVDYWSASTYAVTTTYAWVVYFGNGNVYNTVKTNSSGVWCVRGGQSHDVY